MRPRFDTRLLSPLNLHLQLKQHRMLAVRTWRLHYLPLSNHHSAQIYLRRRRLDALLTPARLDCSLR
jgi:hypothetical protein